MEPNVFWLVLVSACFCLLIAGIGTITLHTEVKASSFLLAQYRVKANVIQEFTKKNNYYIMLSRNSPFSFMCNKIIKYWIWRWLRVGYSYYIWQNISLIQWSTEMSYSTWIMVVFDHTTSTFMSWFKEFRKLYDFVLLVIENMTNTTRPIINHLFT